MLSASRPASLPLGVLTVAACVTLNVCECPPTLASHSQSVHACSGACHLPEHPLSGERVRHASVRARLRVILRSRGLAKQLQHELETLRIGCRDGVDRAAHRCEGASTVERL
eukprot:6198995-Pleurochrysis_carterae.AAC.1